MDLIIPEGINQGDTPRVPKAPKLIPEGWFKTESRVQLQTMTLPMGVIMSHACTDGSVRKKLLF